MDEEKVAQSVVKDILSLPNAKQIALFVKSVNESIPDQFRSGFMKHESELLDLLINGKYTPGVLSAYSQGDIDNYASGKDKISLLVSILGNVAAVTMATDDALRTKLVNELYTYLNSLPEVVKYAKLTENIYNATDEASAQVMNTHDLAQFVLHGTGFDNELNEYIALFLINPELVKEKIIRNLGEFNGKTLVFYTLAGVLGDEETDYTTEMANVPIDDALKDLMGRVAKIKDSSDLRAIWDYFYPAPEAPEAPSVYLTNYFATI